MRNDRIRSSSAEAEIYELVFIKSQITNQQKQPGSTELTLF